MKKFIIFLLAISFAFTLKSQTPEHEWTKIYRDTGKNKNTFTSFPYDAKNSGLCMISDDSGNIYTAGKTFGYALDIDPDSSEKILKTNTMSGSNSTAPNSYILKQNKEGKTIWMKLYGYVFFSQIKLNQFNELYVVGFDNSTSRGFLSKLDINGNFIWVNTIGGVGASTTNCLGIELDQDGNAIITGQFQNSIDFNHNSTPAVVMQSQGGEDIYVAKYTRQNKLVWVKKMGGKDNDGGLEIKKDSANNLYISGYFSTKANFETQTVSAIGGQDIFICKLDSIGNLEWVNSFGSPVNEKSHKMQVTKAGDILICGNFSDSLTVNVFNNSKIFSIGSNDIYFVKFNTFGNLKWAKMIGGKEWDEVYSTCIDKEGKWIILGQHKGAINLDNGQGNKIINPLIPNYSNAGYFILSYNQNGNYEWHKQFSSSILIAIGRPTNIHSTFNKSLYITGGIQGDFYPNENDSVLKYSTNHFSEIFITKFNQCDLTAKVQNKGATLIANTPDAIYQWVDCKNNKELPNSNSRDFKPTATGSYAVIITNGKCTDTSDCIEFILKPTNISDIEKSDINIFPNPSTGIINLNSNIEIGNMLVYDMNGKLLKSYTFLDFNCQINLENLDNGMYLIKIISKDKNINNNLIILNK